uniref:Small ribosomal subunit protein uS15c n=2 Tax=Siraitia grosvenorii TaxID=190515 RepID=A0A6H1XL79_SIRGR|nr:ribosomal protein S15 [Siraitia grosvenorii]
MYKKSKKRRGRRFHFMVKNSFNSVISQEEKKENGGSVEFQVVSFTNKIRRLTSHLELHKKDYLSQRGLRKILGKRQRLLSYLSKKNIMRYKELINQLDIRESKTQ